jgi:hypothetical protein
VADKLRNRWALLPAWARWVLVVDVIGFIDGTGAHIRWMLHGGIHAYAGAYPQVAIQVLFVSLVLLDPLAALLTGLVRREGVWLACVIMVADMIANWAGNWTRIVASHGRLLGTAPWLITAFGVFVLGTAVPLVLVMGRRGTPGPTSASQAA